MSEAFPTITHEQLIRTIIATLEADPELNETSDMMSLTSLNIAEIDGLFQISMVDRVDTDVDYPVAGNQRGGVQTTGQALITILTANQDPGIRSSDGGVRLSRDRANGKLQIAMDVLYDKFRPIEEGQGSVPGVTDLRYASGRTAYPYKGSADCYAVDVSVDFYFTLHQRQR
jgi:hypothetical protein